MLLMTAAPTGAVAGTCLPPMIASAGPQLFHRPRRSRFPFHRKLHRRAPVLPNPRLSSASDVPGPSPRRADEEPDVVGIGDEGVPVEGVIQLERPGGAEPKLVSWAKVGLLAGGDVLCLLAFAAFGRYSHGMPVVDFETARTADPFVAGWLLSAYLLGGFGDYAKGANGIGKAVGVSTKSWVVGIPLGLAIRSATSGHIPPIPFILVAMSSTGVLLLAWRALAAKLLSAGNARSSADYRHGSPFELFELLTSLVRRW